MTSILLRIEGSALPGLTCGPSPDRPQGYHGVHVGMQRRNKPGELLGLARGDAPAATWEVPITVAGKDITGPYVQGPRGGRFVYLSWGVVEGEAFTMFRRAKLWLEAIDAEVVARASETGLLVGRLGLTDVKGMPVCASVRPPAIEWAAGKASRKSLSTTRTKARLSS